MLKQKLDSDVREALKSGDKEKRLVLGMLMSAIKNRELIKRGQLSKNVSDISRLESESKLTDEEILEVIASEAKKRRESVEQFRSGGREELALKEQLEHDILASYLPKQLSEDVVRSEIIESINEVGAKDLKDIGKVVGSVMAKLKGKADGAMVSRTVKELLSNSQ